MFANIFLRENPCPNLGAGRPGTWGRSRVGPLTPPDSNGVPRNLPTFLKKEKEAMKFPKGHLISKRSLFLGAEMVSIMATSENAVVAINDLLKIHMDNKNQTVQGMYCKKISPKVWELLVSLKVKCRICVPTYIL
jgi:hypothetical protein